MTMRNTRTLDPIFFDTAIKELQNFYGGLRLSAEQRLAWLKKLEHFTEDAFRLAINSMIEHGEKAPTYRDLKKALIKAQGTLNAQAAAAAPQAKDGWAPPSPEKIKLEHQCFKLMMAMFARGVTATKRQQLAEEAKALWAYEYPRLPGYQTADQQNQATRHGRKQQLEIPAMTQEGIQELI
jgi:hypothetical protein